MCGITGFITPGATSRTDLEQRVRAMAQTIAHRGPDDHGEWVDASNGIALGHRRLSIIDLTPEGSQPMTSANGRYVVVFNGEIYNFQELRSLLEQQGLAPEWRGTSDTEVMLAAFCAWGVRKTLRLLTGMFAFALWDRERKTLFLARDRIGEKPLYYGTQNNALLFGSELKALAAHPAFVREIDQDALSLFLSYAYVPAPFSIWKGIFKLPAGCLLEVSPGTIYSHPAPEPYWSVFEVAEQGMDAPFKGTADEAADELEALLTNTVRRQMISDVPLGAFLSGGVDSSLVAALMKKNAGSGIRTFTIGFDNPAYNEAEQAKLVAEHLKTDHTELYVSPQQCMDVIPKLPQLYDEPFGDSSQMPTYLVSQLTRQHVTVALSGDGGDEFHAGYNRHFWGPAIRRKVGWLPPDLLRLGASVLRGVSPEKWDSLYEKSSSLLPGKYRQRMPGYKVHKLAEVLSASSDETMYRTMACQWQGAGILRRTSVQRDDRLAGHGWKLNSFTRWMQTMDAARYLADDIMVKVDRASMGCSLETRAPLLDHDAVAFAFSLPVSMTMAQVGGKSVLRKVLYRHVPRELIERPKMGFGVPLESWLRGPLRDWADTLLERKRLEREGVFNADPVRVAWEEHLSGKRDNQYRLWNILMFQTWREEWLD